MIYSISSVNISSFLNFDNIVVIIFIICTFLFQHYHIWECFSMLSENFCLNSDSHKTTYTDCGDWSTLRNPVLYPIRVRRSRGPTPGVQLKGPRVHRTILFEGVYQSARGRYCRRVPVARIAYRSFIANVRSLLRK